MIESLRKALADYEKELEFTDEGHQIKVTITGFLHGSTYDIVKDVMLEYGATYHKWNPETKKNAYWTIPQRKTYKKGDKSRSYNKPVVRAKTPEPSVMLPKLPADTIIHVSYGEKRPNPKKDYHMIQSHITIDVPVGLKADAQLVALDFVQTELAKRLKELEQQ